MREGISVVEEKSDELSAFSLRAKHPLLWVTLLFIVGISIQLNLPLSWRQQLPLASLAALLWCWLGWKRFPGLVVIGPLVIVAGMFATATQTEFLAHGGPQDLGRREFRMPQHVGMRGMIQTDPVIRERLSTKRGQSESPRSCEFELQLSEVKFLTAWEPVRGRIRVVLNQTDAVFERLAYGSLIEVDGVLAQPNRSRNFGLFDFSQYLYRRGIRYELSCDGDASCQVLGTATGMGWVFDARRKIAARLTLGIEKETLAVDIIRGMLLGYREDIPPEVNDSFRRTGTLHVFAISGSHISLIALAFLIGLRLVRFPLRYACFIVVPLLIFYVVATGLRASAIRSLLMAAVIIVGWSIQRPSTLLNNLAVAALIILCWDPYQLVDAGFQLSFVVVASLILLGPPLQGWIRGWLEPDPFIPRSLVPKWRLRILEPWNWCASLIAVCVAAWVGSFGLNLYYFNILSFVALVANLLIVPLASISVALGVVSLFLGLLSDQLAMTFNAAHAAVIHGMLSLCESLSHWKFGYFYFATPSVWAVLMGYAALIVVGWLWWKQWKFGVSGVVFGLGVASLSGWAAWSNLGVRVDVLDVGAGQCVLISGPRFERILIDAGSRGQGRSIVEPFLRSRGVNKIDLAIVSHADAAHYGGFLHLIEKIPFGEFVFPEASFRSGPYGDFIRRLRADGGILSFRHQGSEIVSGMGKMEVLWPPAGMKAKRADDGNLVLKFQVANTELWFCGDSDENVEKQLFVSSSPKKRILIQGLSDREVLTEDFLNTFKPALVVLNTAEFPLKAYPSPELQQRLGSSGAMVYRTDLVGGVRIELQRRRIVSTTVFQDEEQQN